MIGIKKPQKPQKPQKPPQKVMLVKKIPAKAATMVADEYQAERMETGEKSVKFSTTDEILEIESRRRVIRHENHLAKANNIRERLGLVTTPRQPITINNSSLLHRTKKIIKLKQPIKRLNGQTLNVSALKSDEAKKSVKSRLTLKKALGGPDVNKLVNRIGRVSIGARLGSMKVTSNKPQKIKSASSSVFDRLGFNKK